MKKLFLWWLPMACLPVLLTGQPKTVKGRLIDRKTREPIVAAYVILSDGTGTHTGDEGRFELRIDSFPELLRFSHISYVGTTLTLKSAPKGELLVELDEAVSQLGEVEVSARKLRILSAKEDYSIQDFAFDNQYLWLLGYIENQAGKGKLMLASWFGDTIASIPVRGAESLYRDVLGAAYLVMRDSVYQIYGGNGQVELPYSMGRKAFFDLMDPIRAGFAQKLVYADINLWSRHAEVFYREANVPFKQVLAVIDDEVGRRDKRLEARVGSMWTDLQVNYPVKRGSVVSTMINNPMIVPIFTRKDTVFIVNPYLDSLLSYDEHGKFKRAVPFSGCREKVESIAGVDYKYLKINILSDPIGTGVYILEHRTTAWSLVPLDTGTGRVGEAIGLPDYPGMFNITVFGGAVYFLYPEKKWPYFVRLYRYQL